MDSRNIIKLNLKYNIISKCSSGQKHSFHLILVSKIAGHLTRKRNDIQFRRYFGTRWTMYEWMC